jgi:hypothetical protein
VVALKCEFDNWPTAFYCVAKNFRDPLHRSICVQLILPTGFESV